MSIEVPFGELSDKQLALRDQLRAELSGVLSKFNETQYNLCAKLFLSVDTVNDKELIKNLTLLSEKVPSLVMFWRQVAGYGFIEISTALQEKKNDLESMEG